MANNNNNGGTHLRCWSCFAYDLITVWRKDMIVWLKEPVFGFVRVLLMPLMWMLIFGNVLGGTMANLPIAIVDYDNSQTSAMISSGITAGGHISVYYSGSYEKSLELFNARKVYAVLIIPKNPKSVKLMVDRSSPMVGDSIAAGVMAAVRGASSGNIGATGGIAVEEDVHFARGASYLDFLAPGIVLQTIAFAAMFSGGLALILERQLGSFGMLLVAPISKESIVLGKTLAGVTQGLVGGIATLVIAIVMGVKIKTGLVGLPFILIVMVLTAFCFIGMSITMSMRINDLNGFSMVMMMVTMPLWIVSGSLYPIESMAWWLKPIALISPMTYAVDAMRNLMIRGFSFASVSADITMLFFFAVVMLALGVVSFRRAI